MNVVDSSAWLSYFEGDANAEIFSTPIEDIANLIVPSITLTEVFKFVLRNHGESLALELTAHMKSGSVKMLDSQLAIDAAQYAVDLKLPLADSIIYATGRKYDALIWTQDNDFESLEGVKYFAKQK
ncbi:MAG: type II toxin-antitoxin system VapC family toxin [Psychrosphaera sp.]|nr:type II toxin-antitoxin system VapC family toxin [Psychrosphaera sp.]